ncbi:MAG: molybdopterin-binding protein [Candidatus Bathyarchaeia archaeon]
MPCTVEVLSIGNELLLGNTVNTNASWIAAQVTRLGGRVTRITTVADNLGEISRSITEALGRKPVFIITTGGIGPTFDDMTLKGVAKAFHLRIALNRAAVEMIRAHYARRFPSRRITLTKPRLKMASIPVTSVPVINPVGTAPAVHLTARSTEIFCLPGVPSEAKAIFKGTISKAVKARASGMIFVEKWLRIQGVMESSLAPLIDRVMHRWQGVYVKSHPRGIEASGRPNIELHFSTSSTSPLRARRSVFGAVKDLRKQLENYGARVTPLA